MIFSAVLSVSLRPLRFSCHNAENGEIHREPQRECGEVLLTVAQSAEDAAKQSHREADYPPGYSDPEPDETEQFRFAGGLQCARGIAGLYLSVHSSRKHNRDDAQW